MERYNITLSLHSALYKRFTGLMLNLVSDQRAPIVNWKVYFLPSEGIGESGVLTVNTSSQPDRGDSLWDSTLWHM